MNMKMLYRVGGFPHLVLLSTFSLQNLFVMLVMLEILIFQSISYRNTDFLMLKSISPVTDRKWNTVLFLPKYRNIERKKRNNFVTPEKYKPPYPLVKIEKFNILVFLDQLRNSNCDPHIGQFLCRMPTPSPRGCLWLLVTNCSD